MFLLLLPIFLLLLIFPLHPCYTFSTCAHIPGYSTLSFSFSFLFTLVLEVSIDTSSSSLTLSLIVSTPFLMTPKEALLFVTVIFISGLPSESFLGFPDLCLPCPYVLACVHLFVSNFSVLTTAVSNSQSDSSNITTISESASQASNCVFSSNMPSNFLYL